MKIGIQISSDLKQRTGVEEYIYQLVRHLPMLEESKRHRFFLYNRDNLKWPFKKGWTQIRLSLKMLKNRPDILFVPAHTFPVIHPRLVVTIHGLEYEYLPKMYSLFRRKVLRYLTKRSLKKADKVIVPSQNTKEDLVKFYKANPEKIFVIYHGVSAREQGGRGMRDMQDIEKTEQLYLLYLGRIEERKNVEGLIRAFEILKKKYKIPHKLVLAGPIDTKCKMPQVIRRGRQDAPSHTTGQARYKNDVVFTGYVDQDKKWQLIKNADVFIFPSFYEGFGFPVLEAQTAGIPVVASDVSSLPEILGDSALLINPKDSVEIAESVYKIIKNSKLKNGLIKKGYENAKRFSWEKCARETLKILCV